ncbi:uncharacterized protein LOC135948339 [Cloeon dipterum]|uniref:uncharacterized protein LOC135948339 n=1 Tax=Cloeon dipterum TaxID=197152 RepID=UPI00321FE68B
MKALAEKLFSRWLVFTFAVSLLLVQESLQKNTDVVEETAKLLLAANSKLNGTADSNINSNEFWQAVFLFKAQPKADHVQRSKKLVQRVFSEMWDSPCRCKAGLLMQFLTHTNSASGFREMWDKFRVQGIFVENPYVVFTINSFLRAMYNCCFHNLPQEEQDELLALLPDVAAERALLLEELEHELVEQTDQPFRNKTILIAAQLSLDATALRKIVQQVTPALQSDQLSVTRVGELILRNEATFCQAGRAIQEAIAENGSGCQMMRLYLTALDGLPFVREYTTTKHFEEHCVPLANAVRTAYQITRSATPKELLSVCLRNAWSEMLRLSLNDATKSESPAVRIRNGAQVSGTDQTDDLRNLFRSLNLGPCEDQEIQMKVTREVGLENTAGTLVRVVSLKDIINRNATLPADKAICERLLTELPEWALGLSRGGNCQLKNRHTGRELKLRLTFNEVGAAKLLTNDGLYVQADKDGDQIKLSNQPESKEKNQEWFIEPVVDSAEEEKYFDVFVQNGSGQINLVDDDFNCTQMNCSTDVLLSLRHWSIKCV